MLDKVGTSAKLYMLIFIMTVSLIGLGLYGIDDLKKMNENTRTLYADRVLCMQQLANMRFEYVSEVFPMARKVKNHELNFTEAKTHVDKAVKIINTNWHNYRLTYFTPQEDLLVKQLDILKNQTDAATEELEAILAKKDMPALNAIIQKDFSTEPSTFVIKLTQLMELQVRVGKQIFADNKEIYQSTSTRFIVLIIFSLAVALSLSFYIIKNIRGLIQDLLNSNETIKESEKKYHSLLEQASDSIYLLDLNGDFTDVNESMCKTTGYSKEELLQLNIADIIDPEQQKSDPVILGEDLQDHSVIRERRFVGKDGHTFEVESSLKRIADNQVLAIARDITDRKLIEEELRQAEVKFRTAFEYSAIGIALVSLNGKWLTVNISLCEMLGYSEQDLLRLSFMDITHPDDADSGFEQIDNVLKGAQGANRIEKRYIRQDRSVIWVSVNIAAIRDEKGAPLYFVTQILDITERKKAEEAQKLIIENEQRIRVLFDNVEGSTCLIDTDFRLIVFNKVFEKTSTVLAGKEPKFGDEIYGFLSHDEQKRRYEILNRVLEGHKEAIEVEYERNGEHLYFRTVFTPIMVDGKVTAISTYSIDFTERKKAELLLLKQKELSETIINSLPGVFYLQSVTGEYLLWNKNFEIVTGYVREEIVKLRTEDLIVAEDLERVINTIKKLFVDGYATVEAKAKMKDSTIIPFLLTGTPIMYENQLCLLGTGIDISSRIQAEEELKSSEQKYKLLFDNSPVPLWMIARDDLSIIAVNKAAADLHGYSTDELLQSSITIVRLKEEVEEQRQRFRTDVTEPTDRGVMRHVKKDGTIIFVNLVVNDILFEGRLVRLALTNDVTEQLKADELLKKSEANLSTIMDVTDTAYTLLDKELNVMALNQMAVKFTESQFHYSPVIGDRLPDYFPKERLPQFLNYTDAVLKGQNISYEVKYPQPDSSVLWYYVRLFAIKNEKNEILGLMLALSDITERKNAEESLKAAYSQIQDHITSITDMAWKQSHLIRSPLANLKGLTTLLKADPSETDVLDFIQNELDRMDAIIIEMAEDVSKLDNQGSLTI